VTTYPLFKLFKVHVNAGEASRLIEDALRSGYVNEGAQVSQLARALSTYLGAHDLTLMNSCTSAITVALRLSGVGPGDDVVSTPMTCLATNTPITSAGANVVWADVDPDHGMLTPETVRAAITPRTKAVIAVAWAGNPPDLEGIHAECRRAGVKFVLDAAHAFDAAYRGMPVHAWADHTCYSFQAIKHFTTGDGGALVCLDPTDHARARSLKWFGIDRDAAKDQRGDWRGQQWDVDVAEAGYKFNMNNVAAAIGLSQLPYIDQIMGTHRCNAELYDQLLAKSPGLLLNARTPDTQSSHWVYSVRIDPRRSRVDRDQLLAALNGEGIMAGIVHVPNDGYSCFSSSKRDLPGVRCFSANQLSLPCGWWLRERDVWHIATRVKELVR